MKGGAGREDGRGPRRVLLRLEAKPPAAQEAVSWEIEHYVDERTDQLIAEGWDPDEARQEAERRFGSGHRGRMETIERRRGMMRTVVVGLEIAWQALRTTGRTVRRYPGFAAGVVITLGLGIGANTAMFGIIDRLLLQPPAHLVDSDQLRLPALDRGDGRLQASLTYPDLMDWEGSAVFSAVAPSRPLTSSRWGRGPRPRTSAVAWRVGTTSRSLA